MMEVAQLLAGRKMSGELQLRRDIVFAAWSGEELGLRGSKCFLGDAKAEEGSRHLKIAAYLNLDMVGRAGDDGLSIHGTASSKAWEGVLDAAGEIDGLEIKRSESPYLSTDSISFYKAGVPILAAFTGMHDDYHLPSDTIDKIDFVGLDRISRYMGVLTVAVGNAPVAPDYVEVPRGRKREAPPKVRLGLRLETDPAGGVLLTEVVADSASSRAGLRTGDVLIKLDGKKLKDANALFAVIRTWKADREYQAVVMREGNELEVTLVPEAR